MSKKFLTFITLSMLISGAACFGAEQKENTRGIFEAAGHSEKASPQKWRGPVPMWDDPNS